MRKVIVIGGSLVGANVALYLAWLRTTEGKLCKMFVRAEMAKYRAIQRTARQIRDLPEARNARTTAPASH